MTAAAEQIARAVSDDPTQARRLLAETEATGHTRERTTALALQRSLLPQRMPVLGAVAAASRYLPAS